MAVILSAMALASCQKDEPEEQSPKFALLVIYPESGLGDNGYVDGIYRGVCNAAQRHWNLETEHLCPESEAYAEAAVAQWIKGTSQGYASRLLILSDAGYAGMLSRHPEWRIPQGDQVLILDTPGKLPAPWQEVLTRSICTYGASFQSGYIARKAGFEKAAVVCANPSYDAVTEFRQGFIDGWRSLDGPFDENSDIRFLGEGPSEGYDRADSLFRLSYELDKDYDFVFPVCGGSSQGLFTYTREYPESFYTCALDTDCQAYSDHILLSVLKAMGQVVEDTLEDWMDGKTLKETAIYGLESEYVKVSYADVFEDFYPDYTDAFLEEVKNAGIKAENEFLGR